MYDIMLITVKLENSLKCQAVCSTVNASLLYSPQLFLKVPLLKPNNSKINVGILIS